MNDALISFLTPYWCGREMMRIHLASIRKYYPHAPILISKKGGEQEEMEAYQAEFGIRYWHEDCGYIDALLRLLKRCETEYACVLDHDVVILSSLDWLLKGLMERQYDLVGVEERIREAPEIDWRRLAPTYNGWLRFAPGHTACNFILFNLREFISKWGLRGVKGTRPFGTKDFEYDYGIGQKLKRHKYLLPFHTRKYGLGNLLKDGDTAVLWHQWYGSYRMRLTGMEPDASLPNVGETIAAIEQGEMAFLADYPNLDFSTLTPAWGSDSDLGAEHFAAKEYPGFIVRSLQRIRRWRSYGLRGLAARVLAKPARWRRMF